MVAAARTHDAAFFFEHLPITRIIASVALARLLVVDACVATTHTEPAARAPVTDQNVTSAMPPDAVGEGPRPRDQRGSVMRAVPDATVIAHPVINRV
ncbi:hypothetical protein [Microbacterium sp. NPDC077184]|uniref:hypothetical protein n=1 Tax=Microbacterium sp. NPDC077184 TaxID=3154764 RepID=UPI003429B7C9